MNTLAEPPADLEVQLTRQGQPRLREEQANATILRSIPKDIDGRPTRRADLFTSAYVNDLATCLDSLHNGTRLDWQLLLSTQQLKALTEAVLDNRQIMHPAGIPGFDIVHVSGTREVNAAKPRARLTQCAYHYIPPAEDRPGAWAYSFSFRIIHLKQTQPKPRALAH